MEPWSHSRGAPLKPLGWWRLPTQLEGLGLAYHLL